MENPNVTPEKLASSDQVTANQFEAARKIAIATLRLQQENYSPLYLAMPNHFDPEDWILREEIEKAIDILQSVDADLFTNPETDPDVGSTGWLNAALDSRKIDDSF